MKIPEYVVRVNQISYYFNAHIIDGCRRDAVFQITLLEDKSMRVRHMYMYQDDATKYVSFNMKYYFGFNFWSF